MRGERERESRVEEGRLEVEKRGLAVWRKRRDEGVESGRGGGKGEWEGNGGRSTVDFSMENK